MGFGIGTTKKNIDYIKKEILQISNIPSQTISGTSYAAVPGWTLTVQVSGKYEVKACGIVDVVPSASTEAGTYLRLAVDGVTDVDTQFVCMERTSAVASPSSFHHFSIWKKLNLAAGQVVTLWARENNVAETTSLWLPGSQLSLELLNGWAPVVRPVYDTGWINRSDWTNVHMGSNTALNVDSNVAHNFGVPLSQLICKLFISTDGTDANSFDATSMNGDRGVTFLGVDNNNIVAQSGSLGCTYQDHTGTGITINSQNWYYKIKVYYEG